MDLKNLTTDELKELVVKAAEEFYLAKNHGLNLTDLEYDDYLDELKSRIPDFDIFKNLKGTTGLTVNHQIWFPAACKTKINDYSWIIVGLKLESISKLLKMECLDTCPFVAHYQNGNLKYVTVNMLPDADRIAIDDFPNNILPPRLNIQGNFRLFGFMQFSDDDTRISSISIYGRLDETETNCVDWLTIRKELVKTDHYINFNLMSTDVKLPKHLAVLNHERKSDQWWQNVIVSTKTKFTPKMDGCSIVAYYKNGKLWYIASRSNDITGKCKTEYLSRFFPNTLPYEGTIALMCEAVIDLGYGLDWNSRQNANGLINSKYKICDVSKLLNFVCYDAIDIVTNKRLNLDLLRNQIQDNNPIDKFQKRIKTDSIKLDDEFISVLENNEILRNHLCGVHYLPKQNDSISKFRVICTDSEFYFDEDIAIVEKFKPKAIAEINSGNTINSNLEEITNFEHGVIGGLRYARIQYENSASWIFDARDLYRPRVTTVDYFSIMMLNTFIDEKCQAHYHHSQGGTYLNDGLAVHEYRTNPARSKLKGNDLNTEYPFHNIYKWTFNEVADTEVEDILWQESPFGTLIPVIQFKTVKVEGSWLSRASAGGLSRLCSMKCGPGSRIKVVRVNSTIPMVLQVLSNKEFELPTCPHCGRKLDWKTDVYKTLGGALILKCNNELCSGKIKAKRHFLSEETAFNIDTDIVKYLPDLISIENYKPRPSATEEVYNDLKESILNNNLELFSTILIKHIYVNMNSDKLNSFEYWVSSALKVIRMKIGKEIILT